MLVNIMAIRNAIERQRHATLPTSRERTTLKIWLYRFSRCTVLGTLSGLGSLSVEHERHTQN